VGGWAGFTLWEGENFRLNCAFQSLDWDSLKRLYWEMHRVEMSSAVSSGSPFPSARPARIPRNALVTLVLLLSGEVLDRACNGKTESPSKNRKLGETIGETKE
jgi:hypothetical protein